VRLLIQDANMSRASGSSSLCNLCSSKLSTAAECVSLQCGTFDEDNKHIVTDIAVEGGVSRGSEHNSLQKAEPTLVARCSTSSQGK